MKETATMLSMFPAKYSNFSWIRWMPNHNVSELQGQQQGTTQHTDIPEYSREYSQTSSRVSCKIRPFQRCCQIGESSHNWGVNHNCNCKWWKISQTLQPVSQKSDQLFCTQWTVFSLFNWDPNDPPDILQETKIILVKQWQANNSDQSWIRELVSYSKIRMVHKTYT